MKFKLFLIGLFSLAYIISINSQVNKKSEGNDGKNKIAPDNCLIHAEITKVVPAWKKVSKKSCENSKCIAFIKIIKVESYGRTFPEKFTKGQEIQVKFECSLKRIENKKQKLPGLKKGNTFKAELNAKPKFNSNSTEYSIYNYQKL